MQKLLHIIHMALRLSMLVNAALFAKVTIAEAPKGPSVERWSNVFSGEEISQQVHVRVGTAGKTLGWRAVLETAVIARGESAVELINRGEAAILPVKFSLPGGEPKTILPVSIFVNDIGEDRLAKRLWIFPKNPFDQPIPGLKPDELVVFDPNKTTAQRLEETGLKFRLARNVDALGDLTGTDHRTIRDDDHQRAAILLVGEGVSFREYRGLPNLLLQAAGRGVNVVCLAPSAGSLSLPSGNEPELALDRRTLLYVTRLDFGHMNVIRDFDKRLDQLSWRGEIGPLATTIQLNGKANALTADFAGVTERTGWNWMEAEFLSGRLIVCGYRIVELWDAGPTPRHVLRHVLSHAVRDRAAAEQSAADLNRSGPREE